MTLMYPYSANLFRSVPKRASLVTLDSARGVWLASVLYAWAIGYVHSGALSYDWSYLGFTYFPLDGLKIAAAAVLVSVVSLCLPTRFDRPSALVLFMMHVTVFVPSVVITLGLASDSLQHYGAILACLGAAMTISSLFVRTKAPSELLENDTLPGPRFALLMVLVWLMISAVLIAVYGSIMHFADLSEIYDQRFSIERNVSSLGYIRSYYSNIVTPSILAIGLVKRQYGLAALGLVGFILSYMIDAQKAALMIPGLMLLLHLGFRARLKVFRVTALPIFLLAGLTMLVAILERVGGSDFLEQYFFVRAIAIPALTMSQYHDLFSVYGLTWWSNVSGIGLIVPSPAAFAFDPNWPVLGQIVGDHYYGARAAVNVNANPFAGEGVAAAGGFGVLVVGLVLGLWLRLQDKVAKGWDCEFVLLVILPVASVLTNAHLSTTMLSFGGAFWLAFLHFYKPSRKSGREGREQ